jgi:hypothetical protein
LYLRILYLFDKPKFEIPANTKPDGSFSVGSFDVWST